MFRSYCQQYEIDVSQAVIHEMQTEHTLTVAWLTENTDKNNNQKYKLSKDLVWCLHQKIVHSGEVITKIIGYTRAIVTSNSSNKRSISILIHVTKEKNCTIGQWYILKKQIRLGKI